MATVDGFTLISTLDSVDISTLDAGELNGLLLRVRAEQRRLDSMVVQIGLRSEQLAAEGRAGPADETLRGEGEVTARQARREAKRARVARSVPGVVEGMAAGVVGGEHVDSMARHLGRLSEEERATIDAADLLARAATMLPESFDRYLKRQADAAQADHGLGDTATKQAGSEFRHWFDHNTGMGRFSGSLDPERYELLTSAIDQRVAALAAASDGSVVKNHNTSARALVDLVASSGGGDGRRTASVLVVVDQKTLSSGAHPESVMQTEAGHPLPPESVARLCCDATLRRVVTDEIGVPIDVGRTYRTATDAQWAAIKAIYPTCAWDGCGAPIGWCQAHHIHEWNHGGATDLDNLVPLCSRHHHRVHEGRWSLKLLADRTLKIYTPDGNHYTTVERPLRC